MSRCTYVIGDVFDRLAELPDGSVDLVLSSPPFLALRSYLPADHPDKAKEIGSEATPAEFIDTLLRLTAEWRRVLAPHGSIAVELGDTYSGSGGENHLYEGSNKAAGFNGSARQGSLPTPRRASIGWPLAKSLCLIPELYRLALAYGRNPLTGEPSPAGVWRVRNVVRWVRPNPPVGALGDKYRPATSDMVIATIARDRWFDLTAVRRELKTDLPPAKGNNTKGSDDKSFRFSERINSNPAGAPPLDWWKISPGGYEGSHYAVFPPELCVIPIESMCPREVCRACGTPRRRIEEAAHDVQEQRRRREAGYAGGKGVNESRADGGASSFLTTTTITLGWTDCGCGAGWRPGIVLDPFGGSGTTGMVATGHGRDAILIDLDERNADLARERIGMFLDVIDRHQPYRMEHAA